MIETSGSTHDRTNTASRTQLKALLHGTGYCPLTDVGWIRVTGEDRVRWLNGMVTNSIEQLQPQQGCYNFLLSVQGRIQGDATVFATPSALLIETALVAVPPMISLLERFIIMDDVELADISTDRVGLWVAGPEAEDALNRLGLDLSMLPQLAFRSLKWRDSDVQLVHSHSPLVSRFEIWTDSVTLETVAAALRAEGALACSRESVECLRILSGTPEIGVDISDRDLPQETGQTRALHFTKGCYLGQEIVERIRSRGNVHRAFTAFRLDGALPPAGTPIAVEGKQVGEITSVAAIPLSNPAETLQLALGYVRREALERKSLLHYPGGIAQPVETPYSTVAVAASYPSKRA